jgi:hypothetical protein
MISPNLAVAINLAHFHTVLTQNCTPRAAQNKTLKLQVIGEALLLSVNSGTNGTPGPLA